MRLGFVGLFLLTLWPAGPLHAAPSVPTEYWVSPTGSSVGNGSRTRPFQTLEQARNAIRQSSRYAGTDTIVYLRGGTYRLKRTFVLEPQDSGRNGHTIVYRAAPGERPILTGAIPVTGWSLYDKDLGIYRAFVGKDKSTRQLYVNGRRAIRACTEDYPEGFAPAEFPDAGLDFKAGIEFIPAAKNSARWRNPSDWTNPDKVEAVILTQWKMMIVPVKSVVPYPQVTPHNDWLQPDIKTGVLEMQQPGWRNANVFWSDFSIISKAEHPPAGPGIWAFWQVTRFENTYEFLDKPGEWYLNESTGWLYYIPRKGEKMATAVVELPLLEALVDGRGTLANPISNLRFQGIAFTGTTWLDPSSPDGYIADQSGFHLVGDGHKVNFTGHDQFDVRTPGAVRFNFARNIQIIGNKFNHMGAVGLDFIRGCQRNQIIANRFGDISSAAIQLGGVDQPDHHPDSPGQWTRDNLISDNIVRNAACEFADAAGIYVGFATRTTISHNTVSNTSWTGIAMGWGWGLLDPGSFLGLDHIDRGKWGFYATPTTARENKVLNNYIEKWGTKLWDTGAFYTNGRQGIDLKRGLLLQGNVAANKPPRTGSNVFYTDGGCRYVTLKGNVSYNNPVGYADFGPPPNIFTNPLPYSILPSLANILPYGGNVGGCRTYGDIVYVGNYWDNSKFYSPCDYTDDGVTYPINLTYKQNHIIQGKSDVPPAILNAAGARPLVLLQAILGK